MLKYLIVFLLFISTSFAQSVVDDFNDESNDSFEAPDLVTERINRISRSGRIFIITNDNASFNKGDFISLLLNNKLASRAIVAKGKDNIAGIKIVKIYSLRLFKSLREGADVQIIRGDDSYFKLKKKKNPEDEEITKIQDEDDLYNSTLLDDDIVLKDNKNRSIKTDNVIGFAIGQISSINNDGSDQAYQHFYGSWSYQVEDNVFAEGLAGFSQMADFPSAGLTTTLYNFTVKAKLNYALPFYAFIQPYVGFQMISATGSLDEANATDAELAADTALRDRVAGNSFILGATLLKRLVPGWFIRADVGSDILGVGLSLEF